MEVLENKINVNLAPINYAKQEFNVMRQTVNIMRSNISIENTDLNIQMPDMHPQIEYGFSGPELNTPITDLIATGKISGQTNNESILQLIN